MIKDYPPYWDPREQPQIFKIIDLYSADRDTSARVPDNDPKAILMANLNGGPHTAQAVALMPIPACTRITGPMSADSPSKGRKRKVSTIRGIWYDEQGNTWAVVRWARKNGEGRELEIVPGWSIEEASDDTSL